VEIILIVNLEKFSGKKYKVYVDFISKINYYYLMKRIKNISLCIFVIFMTIILSNCTNTTKRQYNISFKNTLSIFLLKNDSASFFCIPIQYIGDDHIGFFNFTNGFVVIGDYEILLEREEINIYVYLNEETDENGSLDSGFNPVYLEENSKILLSKMSEPLSEKQVEGDGKYNHYYIIIERFLNDDEVKRIINEYEKGNINSRFEIWYDLVINNEPQNGSGILDDFELYNGSFSVSDTVSIFPNLNFFRAKYMKTFN